MMLRKCSSRVGPLASLVTTLATAPCAAQTTLYVDANAGPGGDGQTWDTAYRYLQDGLHHASLLHGSEQVSVLVAQGVYRPDRDEAGLVEPGDRSATFTMLDDVAVMGGYAGSLGDDPDLRDIDAFPTVLSGDLNGDDELYFVNVDDNSFHVVTARGTGASAIVDGVTVSGGNTFGLDGGALQEYLENGAGVFCWDGSPTLRRCTFRLCRAMRGGVLYANGETWYDGTLMYVPVAPTIIDCRFTENYSLWYGGAVSLNVSGLTMAGCSFVWNETTGVLGGGALSLRHAAIDGTEAIIHGCRFVGNFASHPGGGLGGALRIVYVPTEIANTLFADNTSQGDGGAVYVDPLTYAIELADCTIARNDSVQGNGGGLRVTGFNVSIRNSILWGNTHGGPLSLEQYGQLCGPAETTVEASCVEHWQDQYAGEHNTALAPHFLDPDGPDDDPDTWDDNDYRLAGGSPCIDAADNALVPADAIDLDGDGDTAEPLPLDLDGADRFVDDPATVDTGYGTPPLVDMGAYEYRPPCAGDLDGSGAVDVDDLLALLGAWGPCSGCAADVTGDGVVDVNDLLALLGAWGRCA